MAVRDFWPRRVLILALAIIVAYFLVRHASDLGQASSHVFGSPATTTTVADGLDLDSKKQPSSPPPQNGDIPPASTPIVAAPSSSTSPSLPDHVATVAPVPPSDSTSAPSTLTAGEHLSPFKLASPSGRYVLSLATTGQLALRDTVTGAQTFASDTAYNWPVEWSVELTRGGLLRLSWANATAAPYAATPWVSSMLPGCGDEPPPPGEEEEQSLPSGYADDAQRLAALPVLELLDSGRLQIRRAAAVTCVLARETDDKGRLAIVYAGFLRTYLRTCADHRAKLVDTWSGSGGVDVHVFGYLDDEVFHDEQADGPVTADNVEQHLRECFGASLKTVKLVPLADVVEKAPQDSTIATPELLRDCPRDRLDHQLSQWKALYLAGRELRSYMLREGVAYDYVFKARLDLQLWGRIPPLSDVALDIPSGAGIVAPRVARDWTWYAALHTGELRAGVTDITALGRPAEIFTYLGLYHEFLSLRAEEKATAKHKAYNSHARVRDPKGQELCTPEGILSYWLELNGIAVATDWRFEMGLLRRDGTLVFTCPEGRDFLCPGFIPKAAEDGTLIR